MFRTSDGALLAAVKANAERGNEVRKRTTRIDMSRNRSGPSWLLIAPMALIVGWMEAIAWKFHPKQCQ